MGKTAICHQLTSDGTDFPKNYIVTQMSEILVKAIKIPDTNDIVELYLVDCSGKEVYQELLKESWAQANLVAAVYDVTKENTFGSVAKVIFLSKSCLSLFRLVQACSGLFRLVQACSGLFRLVQACPDLLKIVQTYQDLVRLGSVFPKLILII